MPGARGQALFETVSAKAWGEWQALQTRLINELQLNMIDPEARKYLRTQMERFLDNEETDEAEGFTPESS
jgi:Fe-S cluster biosynthesis and repair protein YggX